ncbi:protein tyrosine phosphatase [Caulobacter sp.]|uniref:tyrosine phosphatase family protein n=1 Tax=Caulobacter sp. TaxID=78 RepID=UPI002B4A39F9|nr:protein tyrosine phosphatase [Caulobacter sp.]HJV40249.1 protein tyrosine phosphatase [Caulobacter sp.]
MRLLVGPASAVESLLAREPVDHILALVAPETPIATFPRPATVLRFNDIVEPRPGLIEPTASSIREIIGLGQRLPPAATLLIHCFAGVSRSPAAAYILACAATSAGEEEALAAVLRAASPGATPNALMIALADDILGRGGAMSRSIRAIGRGADAFEGDVIDWIIGD